MLLWEVLFESCLICVDLIFDLEDGSVKRLQGWVRFGDDIFYV